MSPRPECREPHPHPEARTGLVDDLSELGLDTVDGEQHGKGKLPTQDHLSKVNHLGTDGADPVEEAAPSRPDGQVR